MYEKSESFARYWNYLKPSIGSIPHLQRIEADISKFLKGKGLEHRILKDFHLTLGYMTRVKKDQIFELLSADFEDVFGVEKGGILLEREVSIGEEVESGFSQLKVWRSFVDNQVYLVLVQKQENPELRLKMMNPQSEPHISLVKLGEMGEEVYFDFVANDFPFLEQKIRKYLEENQITIDFSKEYIDIKQI